MRLVIHAQGAPETPIQGGVWGSMMDKWLHKQDGSKAQGMRERDW